MFVIFLYIKEIKVYSDHSDKPDETRDKILQALEEKYPEYK